MQKWNQIPFYNEIWSLSMALLFEHLTSLHTGTVTSVLFLKSCRAKNTGKQKKEEKESSKGAGKNWKRQKLKVGDETHRKKRAH
jgi:hypothetical protein